MMDKKDEIFLYRVHGEFQSGGGFDPVQQAKKTKTQVNNQKFKFKWHVEI